MGPLLLKHVTEELAEALAGGVISRVHQSDARTIILKVFTRGTTLQLLISAHPALARLHLVEGGFVNPPSPLRFCAFLRSRITGARIGSITQRPGERIVSIELKKGYGAQEEVFGLIAELTGKSSNIILVDSEDFVLDSLKIFPPESSARTVAPGVKLLPLPPLETKAHEEEIRKLEGESWNEATARHYSALVFEETGLSDARRLRRAVAQAEKRALRKLKNLTGDRERAERELGFYKLGELLASNLSRAARGMSEVEATDYTEAGPQKITIPLDVKLSPKENMEKYFKRARKAKVALGMLKDRLPAQEREIEYINSLYYSIDDAEGADELRAVEQELIDGGYIKAVKEKEREQGKATRALPLRRFTSSEGFEVLCGKSGAGNDMIVKECAHKEDIWFHASGLPGSHVLIKVAGRRDELTKKTIEEAASFAAFHSKARAAGKVEVVYTEAKHVRKPPGAKPGMVTITGFKSVRVRPRDMEAETAKAAGEEEKP